MEGDHEVSAERRRIDSLTPELARGLGGYARWFVTSRQLHHAAEQAAERDAPSCPR